MLSLMLAASLLTAPASDSAVATCGCAATFAEVAQAVEENYAGYVIKLPDEQSRAAYGKFRALLLEDARNVQEPGDCRELLDAYLAFFADHHLFVKAVSDTGATTRTAPAVRPGTSEPASAPEIPNLAARWTPEKVEFRLRREGTLDPVEGLWRDDEGQFAIVYDDAIPRGEYVAFRFSYRYGVRPGEIFAFVRPQADGSYQVLYKEGDDAWRRAIATLNRATAVMTFGGREWQRTTEASAQIDGEQSMFAEEEKADAAEEMPAGVDSMAPQFKSLGDGIYYLKLASFMPEYAEPLNAIIAEHGDTLSTARGLVIDIRGNSGGNAIYFPLADWLLTGPITISNPTAVRASDWTIASFERMRERMGERGGWLDEPLKRMRANRGEIVPFRDGTVEGPDNPRPGPKEIVVLQDGGVGSAAEAFVFHARQSPRVVTMGEPTRGNIDYMQVSMHELGCEDFAVSFGYPLYFDRGLPEGSVDDEGYAPDVRLSSFHGDWVEYAERWLRSE